MNTETRHMIQDIRNQINSMNLDVKIVTVLAFAIKISQNTSADIFVNYAPHVNSISIRGYSLGWQENRDADLFQNEYGHRSTIYLDKTRSGYEQSIETLDKVLEQLTVINTLHVAIKQAQELLGSETTSLLVTDATQGIKGYIKTYIDNTKLT